MGQISTPYNDDKSVNKVRETELMEPVSLTTPASGNTSLNRDSIGWSRSPLNVSCMVHGHRGRKKQWHYWGVSNADYAVTFTLASLDYVAVCGVHVIDMGQKKAHQFGALGPLAWGLSSPLPTMAGGEGVVSFKLGSTEMSFTSSSTSTIITCTVVLEGKPLTAHVEVERPPPSDHESLSVVVPWGDGSNFQYTSKQWWLPAEGTVMWGDTVITFTKPPEQSPPAARGVGVSADASANASAGTGGISRDGPASRQVATATLDFGRGVWPYSTRWNWMNCWGRLTAGRVGGTAGGGRRFGLNLGGQWTFHTPSTENGIFLDGKLIKLSEEVQWEYNSDDFLKQWRIRSGGRSILGGGKGRGTGEEEISIDSVDGAIPDTSEPLTVDVVFVPTVERVDKTNLGFLSFETHQCFGVFHGAFSDEDGMVHTFSNLIGWAEDHFARW